jgi:hypothetical protein
MAIRLLGPVAVFAESGSGSDWSAGDNVNQVLGRVCHVVERGHSIRPAVPSGPVSAGSRGVWASGARHIRRPSPVHGIGAVPAAQFLWSPGPVPSPSPVPASSPRQGRPRVPPSPTPGYQRKRRSTDQGQFRRGER